MYVDGQFSKIWSHICTKWSMKLDESYAFKIVKVCCNILVFYWIH